MQTMTRRERETAPLRTVTMDRLESLAGALARRGLSASMVAPPGRMPRLQVARAQAPGLAEDVYASRCQDGKWWFWWPWAERICSAAEIETAAERIEAALSAQRAD